jgi:membrane protein DedA with SNARE-associated domain
MLGQLAASPPLQALVAALSTFVLEDPTTVGAGLLVAEHKMAFTTAFLGVSLGIAVGDLGLYGIGRAAGPRITGWGPLTPERVELASGWFRRNLVTAVLFSRFVPGMRLPTYVSAGVLRAPVWRFACIAVGASVLWTLLLLTLTVALGEAIMPLLGRYRWLAALAAIGALVALQRRAAGAVRDGGLRGHGSERAASRFEFWPPWLFYLPVFFHWMWLAIRHLGLMLPTAANPSIYSGGFIGESKIDILDLVGDSERHWIAPYLPFIKEPGFSTEQLTRKALGVLSEGRLDLPVVAKPDVGQRGDGVQPIRDESELREYLDHFPEGERLMFQKLVGRQEIGVLYWRLPDADHGSVTSITLKSFPELVGDGRRSLRQLIVNDPRARHTAAVFFERHATNLDRVIGDGETFPLVFAGNHKQGTVFRDGTHLVTPQLVERLDIIAKAMPEFHFGRFDLRFDDIDACLRGEDLAIIEINGASGEATHIWDPSMTLVEAYRTLFRQFRALFVIGAANRRRGHRPIGAVQFLRDALRYRRLARSYPPSR